MINNNRYKVEDAVGALKGDIDGYRESLGMVWCQCRGMGAQYDSK